MLTTADLMKFCDQGYSRTAKPWSLGEDTMATDAILLIRVPRLADVSENPEAPKTDGMWPKTQAEQRYPVPMVPLHECEKCGGDGQIDGGVCAWCEGKGKYAYEDDREEIAGCLFGHKSLSLLNTLPNCEISPTGPRTPAWIRFGGGDGLLMPRRR